MFTPRPGGIGEALCTVLPNLQSESAAQPLRRVKSKSRGRNIREPWNDRLTIFGTVLISLCAFRYSLRLCVKSYHDISRKGAKGHLRRKESEVRHCPSH